MLTKGSVIRAEDSLELAQGAARVVAAPAPNPSPILRAELLAARAEAEALLAAAKSEARALVENATASAEQLRASAERTGYEQGLARAIAASLELARAEADADARQLGRNVQLARLLAERIVGAAIELDARMLTSMAEQALAEVRGLSQVRISVHPLDAPTLQAALATHALSPEVVGVQTAEGLRRGDLVLESHSGRLEARLGERLERLAQALRETLK